MPHDTDHLVLPYSLGGDNQQFSLHGVDLGDEVFISGLFSHHYGESRNIPIVRIGNLAALREEPVFTPSFGAMDAYLIEARSIGGLSGSPVFVNLGNMRTLDGMQVISGGGPKFFLLGLIHGHFDAVALVGDAAEQDSTLAAKAVNAGIAIVVPYPSIQSTIQGYKRASHFQTLTFSSNGTLSIASSLPQDTAGL